MIDPAWAALGLSLATCLFTSPLRAPICSCAAPPCCVAVRLAEAGAAYEGAASRSIWLSNQTLVALGCGSTGLQLVAAPSTVGADGLGMARADAYAAACDPNGSFPTVGQPSGSWAAVDTRLGGAAEYRLHMSGTLGGEVLLCVAAGEIPFAPVPRETSLRSASLRSSFQVVVKSTTPIAAVASLAAPAYSLTATATGDFSIVSSPTATHDLLRSAVVTAQSAAAVLRRPASTREAGVFLPSGAALPPALAGVEDAAWTAPVPALMVSMSLRSQATAAAALSSAMAVTTELQALGLLLYYESDASVAQSADAAAAPAAWVLTAVVLSVVALTLVIVGGCVLHLRRRAATPPVAPRGDAKPAEGVTTAQIGLWAHARLD